MSREEKPELRYFVPEEFSCGCGCGLGLGQMDRDFLAKLDRARGIAGVPFRLTSAMRCAAHNRAVGGVPDSAHLVGHAVDIACTYGRDRFEIITALIAVGFNRIGLAKGFVHVDDDPSKRPEVVWIY